MEAPGYRRRQLPVLLLCVNGVMTLGFTGACQRTNVCNESLMLEKLPACGKVFEDMMKKVDSKKWCNLTEFIIHKVSVKLMQRHSFSLNETILEQSLKGTHVQVTSSHHITQESFSVRKKQAQGGVFPSWLTDQLCHEVVLYSSNLLDCFFSSVLYFQQTSGIMTTLLSVQNMKPRMRVAFGQIPSQKALLLEFINSFFPTVLQKRFTGKIHRMKFS